MSEKSHVIDIRSDTVSLPTEAMRQAMTTAEVGDDVYREDPTCIKLEEKAAETVGKEAAIFVCSGTMGNLLACMVYGLQPMCEIVIGQKAHVMRLERGGISLLAHNSTYQIPNEPHGQLPLDALREVLTLHEKVNRNLTRAVFLENTFDGYTLPHSYVKQVRQLCDEARDRKVALHCDGARLWNAAIAQNLTMKEVSEPFDSVQCCLSKGMGAPVGGFLAGSRDFVHAARQFRKMIGGGMRQAGVVAAAGLYAMEHNYERLREDHENAKLMSTLLQEGLSEHAKDVSVTLSDTNMLFLQLPHTACRNAFLQECKQRQVLVSEYGQRGIRVVLHINVTRAHTKHASQVMLSVLRNILLKH